MIDVTKHLIGPKATIHDALVKIDQQEEHMILFVVDEETRLIGTLTDGDIRRALVQGSLLEKEIEEIMHRQFRYINSGTDSIKDISDIRGEGITLVPVLDQTGAILEVLNLEHTRSLLPVHAVLMAGGEGRRLLPQTKTIPKSLLKIDGKSIIQYNLDHLARYGVKRMTISICYLGEQIRETFGDGSQFGWEIDYIEEKEPLGTLGALRLVKHFSKKSLLVMNSDLLTNIDFEDFYLKFEKQEAAMTVATVCHTHRIPYGVIEMNGGRVTGIKEKPNILHHSNAGIYLMRKEYASIIPKSGIFNATDMVELLISKGKKVTPYQIRGYWLDIGRPEELAKAEEDIRHIHF